MRPHLFRSGNPGARLMLAGTALLTTAAFCAAAAIASLPAEEASVPASLPARPLSAASLNINPKRIVLDRTGKSATVYLFNQGDSAGLFDIALIDRVMLPSGQIVAAEEANNLPEAAGPLSRMTSARAMLVATPRRVRLARIAARPSASAPVAMVRWAQANTGCTSPSLPCRRRIQASQPIRPRVRDRAPSHSASRRSSASRFP